MKTNYYSLPAYLLILIFILPSSRLAAQNGTYDSTFLVGTGASHVVQQLEKLSGNKIFAAGDFTTFNSASVKRMVRLMPDGRHDSSFAPYGISGGADGPIRSSTLQDDGKILVGGLFNGVSGVSSKNIARLDTSGAVDTSFNIGTGFNNEVTSLASKGSRIFAAGFFSNYKGVARPGFACLTLNGDIDTTYFSPSGSVFISGLAASASGHVYIAGSFTSYGGRTVNRVARLNPDGTLDTTYNKGAGPNSLVSCVKLQPDGKLIIGGAFTTVDGVSSARIARLNTDGSYDSTFNVGSGASSNVRFINLQQNGKVLIGGDFVNFNGVFNPRITRLMSNGNRDTTFFMGSGTNGTVHSILVQDDGSIVLGGIFSDYNSRSVNKIVRIQGEPCIVPDTPGVSATSTLINCPGGSTTLSITSGNLNQSGQWYWYVNGCNNGPIDSGASITVSPTNQTTYYVHGTTVCGMGACGSITISVRDTIAPVPSVSSLPSMYSPCNVTLTPPTASDACKGTIIATTTSPMYYIAEGNYNITWTYSDGNGNTSTQTQQVVINDTIAPIPDSSQLPTIHSNCVYTFTNFPKATDNCLGKIPATTIDSLTYRNPGTYTVHWIFNDGKGNTASQNQQIVIHQDTLPPVPDSTTLKPLVGSCAVTVSNFPKAMDNCKGRIIGTTTDTLFYSAQGTYTITWKYNDGNGNITTQTQQVIVDDTIAPSPDSMSLKPVVSYCSANVTVFAKATDNCKGKITATTTDSLNYYTKGNYTILWTYNDGNGNTATQVQQVIVTDTIAPVPDSNSLQQVVGACSAHVTQYPKAKDHCKGVITATTTDSLNYYQPGNYTITWKYNDGQGNQSTQIQSVRVIDTLAPVPALSTLPTLTAKCLMGITAIPTAVDACAGQITATTQDPLSYSGRGNYTVNWKYDDGNGNISSQTQNVVIQGVDTSMTVDTAYRITATYFSPSATWQWFKCLPTFSTISGATSRTYAPTSSNMYGVIITDSGCVDTSVCRPVIIISTGVAEAIAGGVIRIFPVPSNDIVHFESTAVINHAHVRLFDLRGQMVALKEVFDTDHFSVDIRTLHSGVYICEIESNGVSGRYKVVKH